MISCLKHAVMRKCTPELDWSINHEQRQTGVYYGSITGIAGVNLRSHMLVDVPETKCSLPVAISLMSVIVSTLIFSWRCFRSRGAACQRNANTWQRNAGRGGLSGQGGVASRGGD